MKIIETNNGAVQGEDMGRVTVFRGIPYALPPLHELRFAAPQPAESWHGVRDATRFSAAATQVRPQQANRAFGGMFGPGQLEISEDCLYLNVWVPNDGAANKPVMVWIHGGAFRMGTGGSPMYDATRLAQRGDVIVVTLNYRLGCFGFTYAPGEAASNAGLRDQLAALQWVNREIEAFGGEKRNITLFGESAGAKGVECLMASPHAQGLFQRAILQSTYAPDMRPESSAAITARLIEAAGVSNLEGLRRLSAQELLAAQQKLQETMAAGGVGAGFLPAVDGEFLPRDTVAALAADSGSTVPAIVGTNRDESRLFGAMMQQTEDMTLAQVSERIVAQYSGVDDASANAVVKAYTQARQARGERAAPLDIWFAMSTDKLFRMHSLHVAESIARHAPARNYLFNWASPVFGGLLGACHGLELPFVFGNMDGPLGKLAGEGAAASQLSERMQDHWIDFARHGHIEGWPLFDTDKRLTMSLNETCGVEAAPQEQERIAYLQCFGAVSG